MLPFPQLCLACTMIGTLAVSGFGCTPEPPAGTPPAESKGWPLGPLPETKTIGTTPLSLKVADDAKLKTLFATVAANPKGETGARLVLVGLEPMDAKTAIKVFLNTTDADPTPAGDSDHLLGTISSYAQKSKSDYPLDFGVLLGKQTAAKTWSTGDPVVIRLVYTSLSSKQPIGTKTVAFEGIRIEATGPKK